MSETPTPRMDAAYAVQMSNGYYVGIWREKEIADAICAKAPGLKGDRVVELVPADALPAERAARERAEAENATLRGLLGNSGKPCAHCGLPVERWGECALGFPGCARADDAQLSDLFAAKLAAEEMSAEVERLRVDAERYRWLRDKAPADWAAWSDERDECSSDQIDAAIDTAIRAAKEGS